MQRMFFHNKYDIKSTEILDALDDDVIVYDVFGENRYNLPKDISIRTLPYMIDRYIDFEPGTYTAGVSFILEFSCMDYLANIITDEDRAFTVTIGGRAYQAKPENGKLLVELTCDEPHTVDITINAENYLPFSTSLVVSEA